MAMQLTIVAAEESERRQVEALVEASGRAALAEPGWTLPVPFVAGAGARRPLGSAVLLVLPASAAGAQAGLDMVRWLRQEVGINTLMVVGPLEPARLIVEAMRAGASEYLETPLRLSALQEALARSLARGLAGSPASAPAPRGQMIAVLGARGGAGATTLAVNLALALQAARAQAGAPEPPTLLLDAAPLGHAALFLNLKPQFTLRDLLAQAQRLDGALLQSLLLRHDSGVEVLAGTPEPLELAPEAVPTAWIDVLLNTYPLVVADLSARCDALAGRLLEAATRILLVTEPDTVSLWSAAKLRQHIDPARRLPFELVVNRYNSQPITALDGLEAITHMPVRCKLTNAYALLREASERGQPPNSRAGGAWSRGVTELATSLLGTEDAKKARSWRLFLRPRESQAA